MSTNGDDDAQRTLEQQALKNVRSLVDNLESREASERRLQKRIIVASLAAVALGVAVVFGARFLGGGPVRTEIVVQPPPPATAPVKP